MRDYQPDINQMLALYQQLEDDVIASMTKRMLKMGRISESTKYEAEILQASGLLYDDILALIAGRTDATKQHVKALFEDAGVQTIAIDNQIHAKSGAVPVAIRQDVGMRRILEAGYRKTLGIMKNLVSTTANLAKNTFISACDRAYMQVSSGAFSYQQAIRQAVKHFGDTGAKIQYPSGHTDRLEVAVRRAVLTGVGQTSAMVSLERAGQADCYLMELTAHFGSRPEHAVWQGQLVSLTGKDVGKTIDGLHVFSLEQIGYQTGAGFKGWNCRHNWHPYYVGLSIPNYTKEQLAGLDAKNIAYNGKMYSEYEISQMQRAAERKVRALKRQVIASQTALQNAPDSETKSGLQADYTQNAVKLKSAERRLKEFCKQTGRRNDTFRTQVDGFGRSEAQKAVWADKKAQESLTSFQDNSIMKVPETLSGYEKAKEAYMKKIKNTEIMKPENKKTVETAMKRIIDEGDFCMRVEESTLTIIANSADKRFKTQMETGISGGTYNPELRKKVAETLFGTDSSQVPNNAFEKYGFLTGKDKSKTFAEDEAGIYGGIIIQFDKNKLFDRTTFTVGDSLNNISNKSSIFAGKVSEPSVCAVPVDNFTNTIIQASKDFNSSSEHNISEFCEKSMVDYVELQYHGELILDDVEIVYYQGSIDKNLQKRLEKSGIKVQKIES